MLSSKSALVRIILTVFIISGFYILTSCSKSDNPTNTNTDTTPVLTSITPNSGKVGDVVTLSGSKFGTSGTVTFNSVLATGITAWADASIVLKVPAGATSGNVFVTVNGKSSAGLLFTVTTTPPPVNYSEYFPATIGSWWIYDRYLVDTLSQRTSTKFNDSTTVIAQTVKDGKNANMSITYERVSRLPLDSVYQLYDNGKFYYYSNLVRGLPEQWLVGFDGSASTWEVGRQTLTNVELAPGYPLSGTLVSTGKVLSTTETMNINGQQIPVIKVQVTLNFNGSVIYSGFPLPTTFTQTTNIWYAKGVGIAYEIEGPIKISVTGIMDFTVTQDMYPLFENTLIKYMIK